MRLAFIYPPYQGTTNQQSIEVVAKNYGDYPPMNLAYVAAVARSFGHEVHFIDASAEKLSKEETVKRLKKIKPDAILFTITTYLFHQTLAWIRYLKQKTGAIIIVGGIHLRLYPKETLTHKAIDYAVIGDCENTLPQLLEAIEKQKPLKNVQHIGFREKGSIIITGTGEFCNFLPGVYPARDLLPNAKYYSFISQRKNYSGLLTSRGCPMQCNYCEQGRNRYASVRETADVIKEIKECYNKHGIREFDFFDPIFTLNKKRAGMICDAIRKLGLDIEYAIRTRTDCINNELLRKLKSSGCKRIYYGIESSDEDVLKNINKNQDLKTVKEAVRKTRKHGIDTFGYFMFGCPGDTLQTLRKSAKYSRELDLDYVQYNNFVALAGTKIYADLMEKIKKDFWAEYTLQEDEPGWVLPRVGTKLTNEAIEKEIIKAFIRFYFRPRQIIKRIIKLKSGAELRKYAAAGADFIKAYLLKR